MKMEPIIKTNNYFALLSELLWHSEAFRNLRGGELSNVKSKGRRNLENLQGKRHLRSLGWDFVVSSLCHTVKHSIIFHTRMD